MNSAPQITGKSEGTMEAKVEKAEKETATSLRSSHQTTLAKKRQKLVAAPQRGAKRIMGRAQMAVQSATSKQKEGRARISGHTEDAKTPTRPSKATP